MFWPTIMAPMIRVKSEFPKELADLGLNLMVTALISGSWVAAFRLSTSIMILPLFRSTVLLMIFPFAIQPSSRAWIPGTFGSASTTSTLSLS